MNFNLTWDLFIIVFFIVVVAYSFIIGKNQTMKVIISSYIAILAADGMGNIIEKYLIGVDPLIKIFTVDKVASALIVLKIAIFVFTIVVLATRGGFEINLEQEKSPFLKMAMIGTYGILSAGLIVSTILIYTSGVSVVEGTIDISKNALYGIYQNSYLVRQMVNYYNVWFSLPAIVFAFASLFKNN